MKVYRILITMGAAPKPITDWLVSKAEAEGIVAHVHPCLSPAIEERDTAPAPARRYTGRTHTYRKQHDEHRKAWGRQLVTRVNLMSGKEFQEPRDTPSYCSPASESYWSM